MKKLIKKLVLVIILIMVGSIVFAGGDTESTDGGEKVTLTFTSWRTEDIERMNRVLAVYTETHPNVTVDFQPISDQEYDAQALAALESGVGADILFLRSYDSGKVFYDGGYLANLDDVVENLGDFPDVATNAWAADGNTYAIPFVGVVHGVFYRKDLFEKYNLSEPKTWGEFLNVCQVLKDNGEVVFAQGTMEGWPLYEVTYSGLGATFYGGEESRQKLMAGDMKLTDAPFVKAFEMIKQLQPYFPAGYESLDYVSMQQMFGAGQAAMFMAGSWELGIIEDLQGGLDNIGWFGPVPENLGDDVHFCFHVDAGIGINKDSKHYDEAVEFINWASSSEFAQLFMNEVPGFYAYAPGSYNLNNSLAEEMIDFVDESEPTVRTVWEKLSSEAPSGNALMEEALQGLFTDALTPLQAAALVQDGIATWYAPFQ